MTKPHGVDLLGRPVDLVGHPITPGVIGSTPGLFVRKEVGTMAKADKDGVYVLNGRRFRIRAGDLLPVGAEMDKPVVQKRAEPAPAPENRALTGAPENRTTVIKAKGK